MTARDDETDRDSRQGAGRGAGQAAGQGAGWSAGQGAEPGYGQDYGRGYGQGAGQGAGGHDPRGRGFGAGPGGASSRLLDDLARLMTDAAGVAQGARREVETVMRSQAERLVSNLDLVSREEFEVVREMAAKARMENDALKARVDALEAGLAAQAGSGAKA